MKVYIAGPYSKGDVNKNVLAAIDMAEILAGMGHVPFVPHLSHFWHLIHPHEIAFWYDYDNEWLLSCDAVLRLPGESVGADAEVRLAEEYEIPVYYSIDELLDAEE